MIKKIFKKILKNPLVQHVVALFLYYYLLFAYKTSKWSISWEDTEMENNFNELNGCLISLWHNRLAFGLRIFGKYQKMSALASLHKDGKLISRIITLAKHKVINGSSSKGATQAVRAIIQALKGGEKIVITPDGPRGPVYQINSNITKLAYKHRKTLIPVSCAADKYFQLRSWDKMMIPKPFSNICVVIGKSIELSKNDEDNKTKLTKTMLRLTEIACKLIDKREV